MTMRSRVVGGCLVLMTAVLLGGCSGPQVAAQKPEQATVIRQLAAEGTVDGTAKLVIPGRGIVSVDVPGLGVTVFKVTKQTVFVQAQELKSFQAGEEIRVVYKQEGAELVAQRLERKIAELPHGASAIGLQELQQLLQGTQGKRFVLFDSRPAARFHQGHIPAAVMLPYTDLKKADEQGTTGKLLPTDKKTMLVFYCGGVTCSLSPASAGIALKHGYTDVRVFVDGEPAWSKAELLLASSPAFVQKEHLLLIDLRSTAAFQAGHIARAVNIPSAVFKADYASEARMPAFKGAPLVFVGDGAADLKAAIDQVRDLGFKRATYLPGGPAQWQQAGIALESGVKAAPERLAFVRKPAAHEVSIEEFKRALQGQGIVIVDARSVSERKGGFIPGSLHVPSEEAEIKYNLVPRDKPVYIHCLTGARGGILYDVLKAKGYTNVKLLVANVVFKNGEMIISE